ncbi:MAG: hypothetical protein JXD23_16650 [Spirochaetales bacterium]|nr:hypothetical protein [Spirochaetales bacterium]
MKTWNFGNLMVRTILFCAFFTFSALPLAAQLLIMGSMTHEKTAAVGESYDGVIEIQNNGDKPSEAKIYQTDYLFYADGRVLYGDPGKTPRSNAAWITFTPKRLTVPPHDKAMVHYTVKIPSDTSLTGTYWSIFMVEGVPEESPESSSGKTKITMGVRQVFRYGIQVVTHIGDTGTRSLQFLNTKLVKQDSKQYFIIEAENTGERWLRSAIWVELYDKNGNYFGKYEGDRLRLYPGTSVRYTLDLTSVPNGMYKALVVIDCGGSDIFGANFNLVLK